MLNRSLRLYLCAAAIWGAAAPAHAQYKPRPLDDPATGESYHIEGSVGIWFPSSDITVASAGSGALTGLVGTSINAQTDLGMPSSDQLPEFQITLRPVRNHKLRMQLIPISPSGSAVVTRDIVFNGQRYRVGTPVNSTLDWKAWRFDYEYDFISNNRSYAGLIAEMKYTDARVDLAAPQLGLAEFAQARAPIPALGGIVRYYVMPNVAVTGEFTGFKIPTIDGKYGGHYFDVDVYGTLNFTNNVGIQGGFRALDLGYLIKDDTGSFTLLGPYIAAVLRY